MVVGVLGFIARFTGMNIDAVYRVPLQGWGIVAVVGVVATLMTRRTSD
jgi:hypothetical protein